MISGTFYALLAGFLGSAASLSAKLSLGSDYLRDMCESGLSGWTQTHGGTVACDWVRRTQHIKRFQKTKHTGILQLPQHLCLSLFPAKHFFWLWEVSLYTEYLACPKIFSHLCASTNILDPSVSSPCPFSNVNNFLQLQLNRALKVVSKNNWDEKWTTQ